MDRYFSDWSLLIQRAKQQIDAERTELARRAAEQVFGSVIYQGAVTGDKMKRALTTQEMFMYFEES